MSTSTINFQDAFIGGYKAHISTVAQYGGQYSYVDGSIEEWLMMISMKNFEILKYKR